MPESADDSVREAADAVRPIFDHAVEDLGLGIEQAQRLLLRMVEAYMKGRTDGADTFALEVNSALSANGVTAKILPKHPPLPMPGEG